MREEIIIAGAGGQGVILAGSLISKAMSLGNLNVTQTQNYGPEARGGSTKCEIVLCTEKVAFPRVLSADIAIFLTSDSYKKFSGVVKQKTVVLLDSYCKGKGESIPFLSTSREHFNSDLFANTIAVGYLAGRFDFFDQGNFMEAMEQLIPAFLEENKKAFQLGFSLGRRVNK